MTPLVTRNLRLRNWKESDRELFHRINSDDRVMAFFPFRRDRAESDAVMDRIAAGIDRDGFGFAAAELVETGEPIGIVGIQKTNLEPMLPIGTVEVGWRLAPEFWGRGYATEAAGAWLDRGFDALRLDEIVSLAVWNNERSTAVMKRLGMRADPASDFDLPALDERHAHLRRHVLFRLARDEWRAWQSGG